MLVGFSDAIVVGEVVSEDYVGVFRGYVDGEMVIGTADPNDLNAPNADLEIHQMGYGVEIDQIHKDSSGVLSVGEVVPLLLTGEPDAGDGCASLDDPRMFDEFPLKLEPVGVSRLFFLVRTTDGLAYELLFNEWARLDIDGPEVMTTGCRPRIVSFTDNTTTVAFLAELAAVVESE